MGTLSGLLYNHLALWITIDLVLCFTSALGLVYLKRIWPPVSFPDRVITIVLIIPVILATAVFALVALNVILYLREAAEIL